MNATPSQISRGARRLALLAGVILTLASVSQPVAAGGGKKKLDLALAQAVQGDKAATERVIIRTVDGKRDRVSEKLQKGASKIKDEHQLINAISADVNVRDLEALAADPDVLSVSSDAVVSANALLSVSTDGFERDSMLAALGLDSDSPNGDKVTIAVIDSGLGESRDLGGARADKFYDFTGPGQKTR